MLKSRVEKERVEVSTRAGADLTTSDFEAEGRRGAGEATTREEGAGADLGTGGVA